MKPIDSSEQHDCQRQCEAKFIRCTQDKFTGCVEFLRVCRQKCAQR